MFNKTMLAVSMGIIFSMSGCGGGGSSSGGGTTSTDTIAPVINLTGGNPLFVPLGGTYSEAGAVANDDIDGEFSATATGIVDTTTAGNYTITYSAVDNAGNNATEITRIVKVEPPSDVGSDKLQVRNGKLVMKTIVPSAGDPNITLYGIDTEEDANNILGKPTSKFVSLEGDVNLLEAKTTGNARSRMQLSVTLKSESNPNLLTRFDLLFDQRTSGVLSRAYMSSSTGGEVSISGIHKLPLTKGTPVKFKIERLNSSTDFAKLTIGNKSAVIAASDLPASDMKFFKAFFEAYIRKGQAGTGDYVKGNIDNVVLKYKDNGANKTYTQSFDGYRDGRKPKKDTVFNAVYTGSW